VIRGATDGGDVSDSVLLKIEHRVAELTINRPAALNALNATVVALLRAQISDLASDPSVRAIVLAGAGDKAFVAGADITELVEASPAAAERLAREAKAVHDAMRDCPKPILAAVNGLCLGAGFELALACDLRIASAKARFGLPEIKLGLIPGGGGTVRLARMVGASVALELAMTGEMIGAERALALGVVASVHPPEDLRAAVGAVAARLADYPPFALAQLKSVINVACSADLESARDAEIKSFALCFATQDQKEGVRAFLDKRPPRFQGI
jgi:enoyl-CoA hydratase/carnithine racemase